MANMDKLNSQLNFDNFDVMDVIKFVLEHQNPLINLALILVSLFVAGGMFNDYRAKVQSLNTQMAQAQEKIGVIKDHDEAVGDLNNFKSALPKKLNEFELIGVISRYAKFYHVHIPSLSPADNQDMGLYDVISVTFSATTDDFKNILFFLRKIEKSDFPLRVDSWSGQEDGKGEISFSVKISAVLIHT